MSFSFDAGASIYLLVLAAVLVAVAIAVLVDTLVHWNASSEPSDEPARVEWLFCHPYKPMPWRAWDERNPGWKDWGWE
jgi:hypothetical protein